MRSTLTSIVLAAFVATGFALPSHAGDGGFWPDGKRLRRAFVQAARDPDTWIPAAGALVVSVGDWDEEISEWAVRRTPVFGSVERAQRASDSLLEIAHVSAVATATFVPGKTGFWDGKGERLLVQFAAGELTQATVRFVKRDVGRWRPDSSNDLSFPSGHASTAFASVALATRNLRDAGAPLPMRRGLGIGLRTVAAGTGWARVEGGLHYPSDVLAGAAVGNFLATFINDAFLGEEGGPELTLNLTPDRPTVGLRWSF